MFWGISFGAEKTDLERCNTTTGMETFLTHVPNRVLLSLFVPWSMHVYIFPGFFSGEGEFVRAKSDDVAIPCMYFEHIIVEGATEQ